MNFFNFLVSNFSNFYNNLNDIGKLVFFITIILFLILIILIIIMLFQKKISDKQLSLVYEDERKLDNIEKIEDIKDSDIDIENEKTRDLKNIVDELQKITQKGSVSDIYEDEQEKTAVISYKELLKAANNETPDQPAIRKIETTEYKPMPQKKKDIFSSVFTPEQQPIYKDDKAESNNSYNDAEVFLNSLKEFRSNL